MSIKRILVIAPHPDDEILGCGGMIAKEIDEGSDVYVCIVTKSWEPLFSKKDFDIIRKETIMCHNFLKIKKTFFLEFPTVRLEKIERWELNKEISRVINEIKPNNIYIPHYGDMQKDHEIVSEACMVAVRPKLPYIIKSVYSYETLSETEWNIPNSKNAFLPTTFIDISNYLEIKKEAFSYYSSQISDFPNPRSLKAIEYLSKYRGAIVNCVAAEAFMLIREIK